MLVPKGMNQHGQWDMKQKATENQSSSSILTNTVMMDCSLLKTLPELSEFTNLGSIITKYVGSERGTISRISQAKIMFNRKWGILLRVSVQIRKRF